MKLILDTDPGVDDALAIAYAAAAPEIDLIGLTTIYGNAQVHQASRNARYLTDLLGLNIPVAQGAALPRGAAQFHPAGHLHGSEGFGDVTDIPDPGGDHCETAPEYLVRMAREHGPDLTICALGPLTNIADALRLDPGFAASVGRLVIMGGAVFTSGNASAEAEANILNDPVAADEVFASGMKTTMVGLEVTQKILYCATDFAILSAAAPQVGGFLNRAVQSHLNFYSLTLGVDGCALHDATAVIACSHADLFETTLAGIRVETDGNARGATRPDPTRPAINICRSMDMGAVMDLFTTRIASLH